VVFDNSDNEFFAFDSAGNGTLLSTNLEGFPDTSWGMAAVGQYVALPLFYPEDDRRLTFFDPDTGQQVPGAIDLTPSVAFESLEYAPVSFDTAGVQGRVWLDANGNGVWDQDEVPAADVDLYLDLDNDGVLDDAEPTATTIADDPATYEVETGWYRFSDLTLQHYVVRQVVPRGFI